MATNIKMNKKKLGLIGGIVLVNTFLVSIFSLGGHIPGVLDDTKKHLITERHEINEEIKESSYYASRLDKKNFTLHYGKPFLYDNKILREVTLKYESDKNGFHEEVKIVPCDSLDEEEYIEKVTYNQDYDDYLVVKQSIQGEILDDIVLLSSMAFASTLMYSVGGSIIDREEEEKKKLVKE